jgi:hypothetical protein
LEAGELESRELVRYRRANEAVALDGHDETRRWLIVRWRERPYDSPPTDDFRVRTFRNGRRQHEAELDRRIDLESTFNSKQHPRV